MNYPKDIVLTYLSLSNASYAANQLFKPKVKQVCVENPKEPRHIKKKEKRTRKYVIPSDEKRCIAFIETNEQCKCSKSYGSNYCFTHIKNNDHTKYQEIEQKEQKLKQEKERIYREIPWYKKLIPKSFI